MLNKISNINLCCFISFTQLLGDFTAVSAVDNNFHRSAFCRVVTLLCLQILPCPYLSYESYFKINPVTEMNSKYNGFMLIQ